MIICLAHIVQCRKLADDRPLQPLDVDQVNHIYALIGGAPLASRDAMPPSPVEAQAGSIPRVLDSVKSFQARSQSSNGCRRLAPGRSLKVAEENLPFPLSALAPGAWPPDASYFDQANPILRTNTLGPAVARAEMIDRLHLGGPVFQQMERPTPESLLLDASPAPAPRLEFGDEVDENGQPCEGLPVNIFAVLARDGYVNK
ncbi:hypothetical protein COCOBI_09-4850 [Coccomyxa sp. Obi]|nr:hypothetical protein COCOBI_09-4850 [Coccomyxa sp. Obi]